MRLQRYMAQLGVASRRACERLIEEGRVVVNGAVTTRLGTVVDPAKDTVRVDGKKLKRQSGALQYFLLHKPRKVVTTLSDPEERRTIAEYLPQGPVRLFPVGRLDYDVNGCLLLTNDGDLANRLMHPSYEVPRRYRVKVRGIPDPKAIRRLKKQTRKSQVKFVESDEKTSVWELTLFEGKYHQVKNMWHQVGHPVVRMSRTAFAGLGLKGLRSGAMRPLEQSEVVAVRSLCGLKR